MLAKVSFEGSDFVVRNMTKGSPVKLLLAFALPLLVANVFQQLYSVADAMVLGRGVGVNALAAAGSTGSVHFFIFGFINGLTHGYSILISQRFGAGDESDMRRTVMNAGYLGFMSAAVITALSLIFSRPLMTLMGTPTDIFDDALLYIRIIFIGIFTTVFYNTLSSILRALGDSMSPLIIILISSAVNIGLDILFVMVFKWGVAGAAWATVLSQLLSAVLCTIVGMRNFDVLRTRRVDFADWRRAAAKHLAVGFPMGFQMSVMCIGQLAMQTGVNSLGSVAVAGYTAATKVDQLSVLMNNAFGIALSSFVAQNYGAGQYRRISEGVRACLVQIELCNVLMCALLLGCRHLVVPLFLDSPTAEVIRYSDGYLFAVCPFYVVLGLLMVFRTAIQSMGNSRTPFEACVIELVMRILGSVGLAALLTPYGLSYTGICLSHTLAWLGATALLMPVYFRQMKALPLSQ